MPNKENLEMSLSNDENLRRRREMITKAKSKSLNPCDNSNDEEPTAEDDNEVSRPNSDKKGRYKSQKLKMKIKRQASLEEQFPISATVKTEEIVGSEKETATISEDSTKKPAEKKHQFLEELKVPKIEIMRKNGIDDGIKVKEYAILSPNSSKLRERFSKSKFLKQDSKNLNVELSKSSDSGIGVSRSTEDDPLKSSESVIFRFFDIGPDTRLNKSDSERSPNFLDTVSLFTRSRSHERSVSSDSSDKNLSDMDKPSIKIRKRHEYSESRDSSSSYEGNIFDAHISNRVRKLHEVALKQMSEESAKKMEAQKRSVEFKYPVEFGSYDSIQRKTPPLSKVRKFKSLERTDSSNRTTGESMEDDDQNSGSEGLSKAKSRLKKQDRFVKRLSLKDKRTSVNRDLGITGKKEKRCRGFLKSWKDTGEDESDENMDMVDGWQEKDSKAKEEQSKRLSRKDKKSSKKTKRALSEEHRGSRRERSLLFAMTGGKKRSDSETRNGELK
ncbi:hypothetical protein RUM44_004407 [Polyplax serrata]|uniref:Uncharacterized protein n=1 Tax=Polyplax serrata TaxID=468196 RepID=A0ABR1B2S3_POLSC